MSVLARSSKGRLRGLVASLTLGVAIVAGGIVAAAPANAISSITPPSTFYCNSSNRTLSIPYPRIWASYKTEQVVWANRVDRWDSARGVWYTYNTFYNTASVNTFGQVVNVQSWVGIGGTTPYGSPINNQLYLKVNNPGYYRIAAGIQGSQGGVSYMQFLAGGGYCQLG